jgi:hypothetical protein
LAEVRVFNPSYTPRSFFAGGSGERQVKHMAKHRYTRHHRRRHNPLGISSGVVKDAAFVAAGAIGSPFIAGLFNFSGWTGVLATGGAAIAASFVGKMVAGASAGEEVLKGGIAVTIIKALQQAGVAKNLGLGSYVTSYFGIPTSSDPYGRVLASPYPAALAAGSGMSGMGMGKARYRNRYN